MFINIFFLFCLNTRRLKNKSTPDPNDPDHIKKSGSSTAYAQHEESVNPSNNTHTNESTEDEGKEVEMAPVHHGQISTTNESESHFEDEGEDETGV